MKTPALLRRLCAGLALLLLAVSLSAADYYVDPATGSMANPGTAASPWSTLEAVFTANKTFAAGDTIHLRDGYHGYPQVKGLNASAVTIRPDAGASPKVRKLRVLNASHWIIDGLDICPENAAPGAYDTANLVSIESSASYVTLQNSLVRGAFDITGWTADDWKARVGRGLAVTSSAPYTSLLGNTLRHVSFGLCLNKPAVHSLVSRNSVSDYMNDGIRALSDHTLYEYNTILNNYVEDVAWNHDDCFQSYSLGDPEPGYPSGRGGYGTVRGVTIRGNIFISQTDPAQPLPAPSTQGIGCFDGMFEDWIVENNLIVVGTGQALALYGAVNCRVLNNTVIKAPYGGGIGNPIINIAEHKPLDSTTTPATPWPVPSSGNVVRNNLVHRAVPLPASRGVYDHNLPASGTLTLADYQAYFTDYLGYDFTLAAGSPAIDAGSTLDTPAIDINEAPRTAPYDIGAHEHQPLAPAPVVYENFGYDPTLNISAAPDSPGDFGWLGSTWTGANDVVTPGLSHASAPSASGNALQISANVGSVRSIDMAAFPATHTQLDPDSVIRLGKPGSTLWLRFLIRADATDPAGTLATGLNLNGAATGGTVKLRIGDTGSSPNWCLLRGATAAASSVPIVVGDTVCLALRIQFVAGSNNDQVDLFINPAPGATPPAVPDATLSGLDIGSFDRVELKGNRTSTLDEISLALDWADL